MQGWEFIKKEKTFSSKKSKIQDKEKKKIFRPRKLAGFKKKENTLLTKQKEENTLTTKKKVRNQDLDQTIVKKKSKF